MNKKNILYVISHPIQYQAPLLRLISESPDIDISVIFYWNKAVNAYFDSGFQQHVQWDVPLLSGYSHQYLSDAAKSKNPFKKLWTLWKIIDRKKYDVVWTHGYADIYTLSAILFSKLKKIKTWARGESVLFSDTKNSVIQKIKRKILFRMLDPLVHRYLAIGTENKNFYLAQNISPQKIVLCPYSVDNHFFRTKFLEAQHKMADLKKSLNMDPEHPVILYAGKFMTRKYPIDLLKAHCVVCQNTTMLHPYLLFIGTGETLDEVQAYSSPHPHYVRFLGFKNQSELPAYFALADIFVLPSVHENWGLVVNEAMNAECAIIVSDQVGCAADLVKHEINGYIYPARDIQMLAHYLKQLTENRALCEKMKKNSVEIISQWGLAESVIGLRKACQAM